MRQEHVSPVLSLVAGFLVFLGPATVALGMDELLSCHVNPAYNFRSRALFLTRQTEGPSIMILSPPLYSWEKNEKFFFRGALPSNLPLSPGQNEGP